MVFFFAILPTKMTKPLRIQVILSDSGVQSPPKRIVKGEPRSLGLQKTVFFLWNLGTNYLAGVLKGAKELGVSKIPL